MIDNLMDVLGAACVAVDAGEALDVNLSEEIKAMDGCPMPLSGAVGLYDADKMARWVFEVWTKGDK